MFLCELFDDSVDPTNDIKQDLMDILTPWVASKVPFVTIQQIMDKLGQLRTGITIDRSLIMDVLDPDKVKIVSKIEGDRIYLNNPNAPDRAVNQDDKQKEQDHVQDMAQQQAQKQMGAGNAAT